MRNCDVDYSGNLFKIFLKLWKRVKAKCRGREKLLQVFTKPDTISSLSLSAVMTAIKIKDIIGYILSKIFLLHYHVEEILTVKKMLISPFVLQHAYIL